MISEQKSLEQLLKVFVTDHVSQFVSDESEDLLITYLLTFCSTASGLQPVSISVFKVAVGPPDDSLGRFIFP